MRTTAPVLSQNVLDMATGLMSLPAVVVAAVGLAVLFGLALISGAGLYVLSAPLRSLQLFPSSPHRVGSATKTHP